MSNPQTPSCPAAPQTGPQAVPMAVPVLLAGYLAALPRKPFDWRTHNCCHWAAGWVRHATGLDPMQGLRATPTLRAALRMEQAMGGMQAAVSARLGCESVPAADAQAGDLVLFLQPAQHARRRGGVGAVVAVCLGLDAVCLGERGELVRLSMDRAACAWRLSEVRR